MNSELISVKDAAKSLGINDKHLFKVLTRLKIERILQKSSEAKGQKIAYITPESFESVRSHIGEKSNLSELNSNQENLGGVFYLIQLEPEHDPNRFKLGFATNIEERLRSHKTSAPLSKVLKTWPCKLLWEKTAIECVSQDCERIHTEVFRAKSIEQVLVRCNNFFNQMPGTKPNGAT